MYLNKKMITPTISVKPTLKEAEIILSQKVTKHIFTILVAECKIQYIGRSSSKMDWGERVIMLKPDGSVLIHRKNHYNAVNWQPPGASISVSIKNELLIIKSDRRNPRENLLIYCKKIMFTSSFSLKDEASFDMLLSETDIYDILMLYPNMIESGFRISKQQKKLGGGKADIIGFDSNNQFTVVEVKRVTADSTAVKQLYQYILKIRKTSPKVRGILLAPSIRAPAKKMAQSLSIEYIKLDLKKCSSLSFNKKTLDFEKLDKHLV